MSVENFCSHCGVELEHQESCNCKLSFAKEVDKIETPLDSLVKSMGFLTRIFDEL